MPFAFQSAPVPKAAPISIPKPKAYGTSVPGLSGDDTYWAMQQRRAITRARSDATNQYTYGSQRLDNTLNQQKADNRQGFWRGVTDLNSAVADTGFGNSPALAARGVTNLRTVQANNALDYQNQHDSAMAALEKMKSNASNAYHQDIADLTGAIARRRNWNGLINRIGSN